MRSRRLGPTFLILLLVAAIGTLAPIADASPPDPSWIRGLYDGADFDDVIGLITSGTGLVGEPISVGLRPDLAIVIATSTAEDEHAPWLSPASAQPRAPPAA